MNATEIRSTYIRMCEDEFSNSVIESITVYTITGGDNQVGGGSIPICYQRRSSGEE